MEIREFRDHLAANLVSTLGEGYDIIQQDITKINRIEMLGLCIHKKNAQKAVLSPVVYVEGLYERFKNGAEMSELVDSVIDTIDEDIIDNFDARTLEFTYDWDKVRKFVRPKLINTGENQELLKCVPSVPFCNLSVIFYIQVHEIIGNNAGCMSIMINNDLKSFYDVTVEELFDEAVKNMEMDGISVRSITSVIFNLVSICDDLDGIDIPDLSESEDQNMFVMTNSSRVFGAAAIVSKNVRAKLAEKFGMDCYILPSSIHELLVIPCSIEMGVDYMYKMVSDVNDSSVAEADLLATGVYLFHADTLEVEQIA